MAYLRESHRQEAIEMRGRESLGVELPIPIQWGSFDFLLAQQKVQGCRNGIGLLAQLSRQIVLTHHHIACGVSVLHLARICQDAVCEHSSFLLLFLFRTLASAQGAFWAPFPNSTNGDSGKREQKPPVELHP